MIAIPLVGNTDALQVTSDAAGSLDCVVGYMDRTNSGGALGNVGRQATAITTATTATILSTPASGDVRNATFLNIRNKHTTVTVAVQVMLDISGTDYELHKVSLAPGDALTWTAGLGWYHYQAAGLAWMSRRVTTDVTNATTSWADITGLTAPVEAGKHYNFEAFLMVICNATTTGARFGANGPAATAFRGSGSGTVTGSVTAAATSTPVAPVTAYDTSLVGAQTTGPATEVPMFLAGYVNPSASGTFAIRSQSEVAVANAVIIRAGSFMKIWEAGN